MKRRGFLGGIVAALAGLLCKPASLLADDPSIVAVSDIERIGNDILRDTEWVLSLDGVRGGTVVLFLANLRRLRDPHLRLLIHVPPYIAETLSTKELKLIIWNGMKCAEVTTLLSLDPCREAFVIRFGSGSREKIVLAYANPTQART